MKILAFESSCDETAAAVVEDGRKLISNSVLTQIETHKKYGGVVPEIASRAHTEAICTVYDDALEKAGMTLKDIDAIAVTSRPGLIGALHVGINFAKSLAFANNLPIIPVNHIEGHIAAAYLTNPELEPPFIAMVMSGGHTSIVKVDSYTDFSLIGATRDDAIGEAFDKSARVLGIPYPGGKIMDELAHKGDADKIKFPPAEIKDTRYDFSFSGLKTALINYVNSEKQKGNELNLEDISASFTKAVTKAIFDRLSNVFEDHHLDKLVLCGGVAANSHIRNAAKQFTDERKIKLFLPEKSLCGDNGAMIASQGYYNFLSGITASTSLGASAQSTFNYKN